MPKGGEGQERVRKIGEESRNRAYAVSGLLGKAIGKQVETFFTLATHHVSKPVRIEWAHGLPTARWSCTIGKNDRESNLIQVHRVAVRRS